MSAIWMSRANTLTTGNRVRFVECDHSVNAAIKRLRDALGARPTIFIKSRHRDGPHTRKSWFLISQLALHDTQ